jgi:hypothetical protein
MFRLNNIKSVLGCKITNTQCNIILEMEALDLKIKENKTKVKSNLCNDWEELQSMEKRYLLLANELSKTIETDK